GAALAPGGALRAAPSRPVLPDRPATELQREVPAGLAAAVPVRRAGARLPGRRACVPAGRVAPHAAGALGGGPRPDHRVRLASAALLALLAAACASAAPNRDAVRAGGDWARFGYDAARRNAGPGSTGITAENVGNLRRQRVGIPGTADSSPIYLR